MENKIVEYINYQIEYAVKQFKENGGKYDEAHSISMNRINAMIEILALMTGKRYTITEGGLVEE